MHSIEKLFQEQKLKKSSLFLGLDPDINYIPKCLLPENKKNNINEIQNVIYNYLINVINICKTYIVGVKIQLAYFEQYGSLGIATLEKIANYARQQNLVIIQDAKRGDIGNTSKAYANAFLNPISPLTGDFVTISPYLGSNCYMPFIEIANKHKKGVFILLKTSNPSSEDLQDKILKNGKKVYQHLAEKLQIVSRYYDLIEGYSHIGCVIGATYPKIIAELRKQLNSNIFLLPGIGAQGGCPKVLKPILNSNDGIGSLYSSSRGLLYPYMKDSNWEELEENKIYQSIEVNIKQVYKSTI